jgi:hypothetical protein
MALNTQGEDVMRRELLVVATAALMLAGSEAQANLITGTFSGIVQDSRLDPTGRTNFNGERVDGTFSLDPTTITLPNLSTPVYISTLAFDAHGEHLIFSNDGGEPSDTTWAHTAGGDILNLDPSFQPYYNAALHIAGPYGGLFNTNDLSSFNLTSVDFANSFASFFGSREFGASISLDQISANGITTTSVPEGSSTSLFAAGLLLLAFGKSIRPHPGRGHQSTSE